MTRRPEDDRLYQDDLDSETTSHYVSFGDLATQGLELPRSLQAGNEAKLGEDLGMTLAHDHVLMRRPIGYRLVWSSCRKSLLAKNPTHLYCWAPVPPHPDYVALGVVVTVHKVKPSFDLVRCVPKQFLFPLPFTRQIWNDVGTGGVDGAFWAPAGMGKQSITLITNCHASLRSLFAVTIVYVSLFFSCFLSSLFYCPLLGTFCVSRGSHGPPIQGTAYRFPVTAVEREHDLLNLVNSSRKLMKKSLKRLNDLVASGLSSAAADCEEGGGGRGCLAYGQISELLTSVNDLMGLVNLDTGMQMKQNKHLRILSDDRIAELMYMLQRLRKTCRSILEAVVKEIAFEEPSIEEEEKEKGGGQEMEDIEQAFSSAAFLAACGIPGLKLEIEEEEETAAGGAGGGKVRKGPVSLDELADKVEDLDVCWDCVEQLPDCDDVAFLQSWKIAMNSDLPSLPASVVVIQAVRPFIVRRFYTRMAETTTSETAKNGGGEGGGRDKEDDELAISNAAFLADVGIPGLHVSPGDDTDQGEKEGDAKLNQEKARTAERITNVIANLTMLVSISKRESDMTVILEGTNSPSLRAMLTSLYFDLLFDNIPTLLPPSRLTLAQILEVLALISTVEKTMLQSRTQLSSERKLFQDKQQAGVTEMKNNLAVTASLHTDVVFLRLTEYKKQLVAGYISFTKGKLVILLENMLRDEKTFSPTPNENGFWVTDIPYTLFSTINTGFNLLVERYAVVGVIVFFTYFSSPLSFVAHISPFLFFSLSSHLSVFSFRF